MERAAGGHRGGLQRCSSCFGRQAAPAGAVRRHKAPGFIWILSFLPG